MSSILVIDDEPAFCDLLKTFLESEGHTVQVTTTAEAALEYLEQGRPELVLMDVRMPDINGLELLPQIKASARDSHVIVITGLNDYRIADLLYEAGADGYLTKPLRLDILAHTISRLTHHRQVSST